MVVPGRVVDVRAVEVQVTVVGAVGVRLNFHFPSRSSRYGERGAVGGQRLSEIRRTA